MSTFRADGAPSRDDTCEHDYRRFEKCPHCLAALTDRLQSYINCEARFGEEAWFEPDDAQAAIDEIERLREALREISTRNFPEGTATLELRKIARAALGEGKE